MGSSRVFPIDPRRALPGLRRLCARGTSAACAVLVAACVSIEALPPEVEQALGVANANATLALLRDGHFPTEGVLLVRFGRGAAEAEAGVSSAWSALYGDACAHLARDDPGTLRVVAAELDRYLTALSGRGAGAEQLGAFSRLLAERLEDPTAGADLRAAARLDATTDEHGRVRGPWTDTPRLFGELAAGFVESRVGVGRAAAGSGAPFMLGVRLDRSALVFSGLAAGYAERPLLEGARAPDLDALGAGELAREWQQGALGERDERLRGFAWRQAPGEAVQLGAARVLNGEELRFPVEMRMAHRTGGPDESWNAAPRVGASRRLELRLRWAADARGTPVWRGVFCCDDVELAECLVARR